MVKVVREAAVRPAAVVAALVGGALLLTAAPAGAVAAAPGGGDGGARATAAASGRNDFGPYGYRGVKLGMTAKQAKATGKIKLKLRDGCSGWDYKAHPNPADHVSLYISPRRGVAVIFAPKGVRTPRGIGVGATLRQVKKVYPRVREEISGWYATVPGNRKAYYYFGVNERGKLEELGLGLKNQDCVS